MNIISTYMADIGRNGGRARSPKKSESSKKNFELARRKLAEIRANQKKMS